MNWLVALLFGIVLAAQRSGPRRRGETLRTGKGRDPLSRSGRQDDQGR